MNGRTDFRAVVFDMDGVVTRTAELHAAAWKELFDDYLAERGKRADNGYTPFDMEADYLAYVDGKPRGEGASAFLASRGIDLPYGRPDDGPERETVCGLGNRKDRYFERRLHEEGAKVYGSTVALIEALRARGLRIGLVTSSRHGREVLETAGAIGLFHRIIDGVDAAQLGLKGKPEPDIFIKAAGLLDAAPAQTIVVEDAVSGVEAGRLGHFGLVVGVDRGGNREALAEHGADLVVDDLAELTVEGLEAGFRKRLESEARKRVSPGSARAWRIEQEGFDPAREHGMETLFTVGNGYMGVRGALDTPMPGSQADLFIAGVYDRKQPSLPYSELEFLAKERGDYAYSEIVSLPFPFGLRITVDGQALDLMEGPWRDHRRVLELARGALASNYLYEDGQGRRTRVESWRCASLADRHLLLQEVSVTCENHSSMVQLDASIRIEGLEVDHPHLIPQETPESLGIELRVFTTRVSGYTVALASRTHLEGEPGDRVYWQAEGCPGESLRWRRYTAVFSSRDGVDPVRAAMDHLLAKSPERFDADREAHEARFAEFWSGADIRLESSPETAQALRFGAYHLRSAADHDPRVSVTARTLSGRAYEGHVFWDVEVFMLPFYLHTAPAIARSLLSYRYSTLAGARRRANKLGYRGACYAWESTVTGEDATPRRIVLKSSGKEIPIYTGYEQVHVSAGVAYGVWQYWESTRDATFLLDAGAEILLDTARFWASRCTPGNRHFHIRAVTGPDEYHHTVNDNAYTNWMARFNLEKALWVRRWLAENYPEKWEALRASLALGEDEPEGWQALVHELYVPGPDANGVIEQFEGFFDLRQLTLAKDERFRPPLQRLFAAEETNESQVIKQADVLMLPFLFPDAFSPDVIMTNYRFYEPRTDHGSSLSPAVHAAVAARIGLLDDARRYWRRGLWLDLSNTMGNSSLGIHAACMGGIWQALVFGFLGVRFTDEGPVADPNAPERLLEEWGTVHMQLAHRGQVYPLTVGPAGGES